MYELCIFEAQVEIKSSNSMKTNLSSSKFKATKREMNIHTFSNTFYRRREIPKTDFKLKFTATSFAMCKRQAPSRLLLCLRFRASGVKGWHLR